MASQLLPTVVVIGMVGRRFGEKLLAKSTAFNLVVFGEELRVAYDRVHLSEYFAPGFARGQWSRHRSQLRLVAVRLARRGAF